VILLHHDDDVIDAVQVAVGANGTVRPDEQREHRGRRCEHDP